MFEKAPENCPLVEGEDLKAFTNPRSNRIGGIFARPWLRWFDAIRAELSRLFVDADIAAGAAIAWSKIDKTGAVLTDVGLVDWTEPAFSAGDFTASGAMTWTVSSGDRFRYAYAKVGNTLLVQAHAGGCTVAGTPDTTLRMKIPGGFTAAKRTSAICWIRDNNVPAAGLAEVLADGTYISVYLLDLATAWTACTDTNGVRLQMSIEVKP